METQISRLQKKVNALMVLGSVSTILTIVKFFILIPNGTTTPTPSNSNSVQIGDSNTKQPQRDFLNTDEVGEREGVTSRTVTTWVEQGRISPPPTRQGRAWIISANYRILPQTAANNGND